MSALDDARAVLVLCEVDVGQPIPGVYQLHEALAALVAEIDAASAPDPVPSPEALDLRHAGHAPLMEPEGGEVRGYARDAMPDEGGR